MTTTDTVPGAGALSQALLELRRAVAACAFDLGASAQAERRQLRERLAAELAGHVAKLADLDAPLLVVIGGVTGAGKSTFVNTLLGRDVLAAGPVRPTTFAPSLVCHPDDLGWFETDRILGSLARVETADATLLGGREDSGRLRLVSSAAIPPGLALLDAPDIDSVSTANRELADQLLDAADLWLWFTTAGKYADEESMRYLRRAQQRRTALAVVLAQVHAADLAEVAADFRHKLGLEGLAGVNLFTIPVATVAHGRLPGSLVGALRDWLYTLGEPEVRRAHRLQTLSGALDAVPGEVAELTAALDEELRLARQLLGDVDRAYEQAGDEFAKTLDEGLPLRAEVVDRWDRFVGGGKFLKLTEAATGQARTWVKSMLANVGVGEEQRLERQVRVEVADTVTGIAAQLADLASADVVTAWQATPSGRRLLAAEEDLTRRSRDFDERAETAVAEWQQRVAALVATAGAARRNQARVVSSIVSVAATSAILLAMAHSGITGAEAGIAAAAGAANQGLLVKLLGEANLRALVTDARDDLLDRFSTLTSPERQRFRALVAEASPDPEHLDVLAAAADAVAAARRAAPRG